MASTSASSSAPREAFTRTTSPGRRRSRSADARGVAVGHSQQPFRREPGCGRCVCREARALPDDDQVVHEAGGRPADLAMTLVGALPELEHLAQHGHVASGQAREQLHGGAHRARRRVIGIVEDGDRAGGDQLAAVRRHGRGREPTRDVVDAEPRHEPNRRGRQCVVDGVPSKGRDPDPRASGTGSWTTSVKVIPAAPRDRCPPRGRPRRARSRT